MKKYFNLVLLIPLVFLAPCGGGGEGGDDDEDEEEVENVSDPTEATITSGTLLTATLDTSTVGADGGTITSTDLTGVAIEVPAGATGEDITFTVSYAPITDESGLPEGTSTSSQLIRITTSGSATWNEYRTFDLPIKVTLPYTEPAEGEESVRFYVYNNDGTLEPTGYEIIDSTNNTITFYISTFANAAEESQLSSLKKSGRSLRKQAVASTFSDFVAVGLNNLIIAWFTDGLKIDTEFRAASDGWYIPNYGSYYKTSKGGNCMGMVSYAKYYYRAHGSGLRSEYHDEDDTTIWQDDETAIELASRAHEAESNIWNQHVTGEVSLQTPSSHAVALSYLGGLFVTNQPVLLYIQQTLLKADGTTSYKGAHAIMVYGADITAGGNITFHVYDPNFPNSDSRTITYVDGTGFSTYSGGPDAATPGYQYNFFKHFGYNVAASDAIFDQLTDAADVDFEGTSVFPDITSTSITGKTNLEDVTTNEEETDEGEHKYVTSDTSVVISGTVLGGIAQSAGNEVTNINVFVGSDVYTAAVTVATGAFTITVPLKQGENEVVMIASKANKFSHWAAFYRDIIESTASASSFTVTMSWAQGESDVDLYVREPSFTVGNTSYTGNTIYYQNSTGTTASPYLDFDNTSGYGPEHYYAESDMTTLATDETTTNPDGLYGTYTVRMHYYADHDDDDESDQPISWSMHYRYLAFCEDPCTNPEADGFWEEGNNYGSLSNDTSSSNCCNIDNASSGDWSTAYTIEYPEPDPEDYVVPASHDVMLP